MQFNDVSLPEVYTESADFRFFLKWFASSLSKLKYDHENLVDLYDPLRCADRLVWMLADTMGFKYDSRLSTAFNRLVLIYFMSMIRNRGSNDGVTLAAETNLAQFSLNAAANEGYEDAQGNWVPPKEILNHRLEDTSIPVNSAYVTSHVEEGYIDVVYFSTKLPIDACIEYVRPLGMYLFQTAGVRFDGRTKVSVDARLTNMNDLSISIGPTHVGHYRREDYARLQKSLNQKLPEEGSSMSGYSVLPQYTTKSVEYLDPATGEIKTRLEIEDVKYAIAGPDGTKIPGLIYKTESEALAEIPKYSQVNPQHIRQSVYYRNSAYEKQPNPEINPGYRSLYSLQISNNDHIVKALIDPYFSLGYGPQDVSVTYPDDYLNPLYVDRPNGADGTPDPSLEQPATKAWNLRYNAQAEYSSEGGESSAQAYTLNKSKVQSVIKPQPAVNPIASKLGDAVSMDSQNKLYTKTIVTESGDYATYTYDITTGRRVIGYNEDGTPIFE